MRTDIQIGTIDTHTEGEPTRIIVSGLEDIRLKGGSVKEKRDTFKERYDWVRELLMKEPRGHNDMFGAVIVPPESKDADIGVFYIQNKGYLDMCGHATIGIISAFVETGRVEEKSPIILETPAGLVKTWPEVEEGCVKKVTMRNVDSFVYGKKEINLKIRDKEIEITADIVYSGNTIALVDIKDLEIDLDTKNLELLIKYGLEIRKNLNDKLDLRHKITGEKDKVDITEFYEHRKNEPDRNVVIFADGSVDRSPCGTGTCAKMTHLYDKGELDIDEKYEYESIIGTIFEGRIVETREENDDTFVVNEISGSAYIISENTFYLDPNDPIIGFNIYQG